MTNFVALRKILKEYNLAPAAIKDRNARIIHHYSVDIDRLTESELSDWKYGLVINDTTNVLPELKEVAKDIGLNYLLKSRIFFPEMVKDLSDSQIERLEYLPVAANNYINNLSINELGSAKNEILKCFSPEIYTRSLYMGDQTNLEKDEYIDNFLESEVFNNRINLKSFILNCREQVWKF